MRFRLVTEASAAAMEIERLMVAHSRNLPATVAQDMFDNYMRFSAMAYRAGMIGTPKTHLMMVLVCFFIKKSSARRTVIAFLGRTSLAPI